MAIVPPLEKSLVLRQVPGRRLLVTLLALSLLANLALLLTRRPASSRGSLRATEHPPAETRTSEPPFASTDLRTLATSLHNSAVPSRLIRAYLAAEIDENFRERTIALRRPKNPALHWWQSDNTPVPLANRLAQLALHREISRVRAELLGPDPDAPDDGSSLAPAKREAARLLAADYAETIDAITEVGYASRFQLPAEKAAVASLEAQRKAELAALLTPAELADFELRTSPTTEDIRDSLHGFDANDEEFAAIYEFWKRDNAAQGFLFPGNLFGEDTAAPLRTMLGEARFAEFQRARDPEFETLRSLGQRASLAPEVAEQVFDLRAQLEKASGLIGYDETSNVSEKLAALQTLARDTRTEIQAKLGPEASAAYLKGAEQWLSLVETGSMIEFLNGGWQSLNVALPRPGNAPPPQP